ncbi:MAG: hypothetical protein J6Q24_05195 [Clostridia bacterium]|nr:hypothetical protein [Clostridia bacterium]
MTSAIPETKKQNKMFTFAAVLYVICMLFLGTERLLPFIKSMLGLKASAGLINILVFAAISVSLFLLAFMLPKANGGGKLFVPFFVLAGCYLLQIPTPVYSTVRRISETDRILDTAELTSEIIRCCVSVCAFVFAAVGFGVLGLLFMLSKKQNQKRSFVWVLPVAAFLLSTILSGTKFGINAINVVSFITSDAASFLSSKDLILWSLTSVPSTVTFAVMLLYTVAAALIATGNMKK